ncbi:hypothetical protein BGW80DRAFT_1564926 [Lactifluus volemus]|nr:hypothetical protein BGW80DRAFT_1564926 [Lactifluus volemus]
MLLKTILALSFAALALAAPTPQGGGQGAQLEDLLNNLGKILDEALAGLSGH